MEEEQQVEKRHLHVAILTQGTVRWELSNFVHHMLIDPEARKTHDFSVRYYMGNGVAGRPVSSNRNRIVRDRPLGSDLLMLDHDIVPHHRLLEITLQGLDIVICPVPIWKAADTEPCPVRINMNVAAPDKQLALGSEQYDELIQGGTGAIYISNEALDHPAMRAPFQFLLDEDGVTFKGEDYSFCDRARLAGFKVWSANAILCGHIQAVNLLVVMRRYYEQAGRISYEEDVEGETE